MGPTSSPSGLKAERAIRRVGWIALLAACLTVGLIVYGGWVRASGSGLGCPDWPLCKGALVPELQKTTAIELGHRVFAAITGVVVLAATIMAFFTRRSSVQAFRLLAASLVAITIQALVGRFVVASELRGDLVVLHLTLAMATLALLSAAALQGLGARSTPAPNLGRTTFLLVIGAIVILMGAFLVGTGNFANCLGLPFCDDRTPTLISHLLHGVHRILAAVLMVALVWSSMLMSQEGAGKLFKALNHGVGAVMVVQIMVGLLSVWYVFPEWLRVLHLGLATFVWWGLASSWTLTVSARRA